MLDASQDSVDAPARTNRRAKVDRQRLHRLCQAISLDVSASVYDGAVICVAQHGELVCHEAVGWADRARGLQMQSDSAFFSMSIGKQFIATLALNRVECGALTLNQPIADVIPEFGCRGKQPITLLHLLTHTSGLPTLIPGLRQADYANLSKTVAAVCATPIDQYVGTVVSYSAYAAHAIIGELLKRVDGQKRPLRQILQEDLFAPLKMSETSLGLTEDAKQRVCPIAVRDVDFGEGGFSSEVAHAFNQIVDEHSELASGGYMTTGSDMYRFAEMLRRGGELDGNRVLSPATISLCCEDLTGTHPYGVFPITQGNRGWQPFPSHFGLGFTVRGQGMEPTPFGTLSSRRTFGGVGMGSTLFWIDPDRDLSFVCLSTGLLEESRSIERFQRLSDIVIGAVTD